MEVSFRDPPEDMLAAIKKFVARNPKLDALFFATNYLGVLGIEALKEGHLKIGEDIAVVSFDDKQSMDEGELYIAGAGGTTFTLVVKNICVCVA